MSAFLYSEWAGAFFEGSRTGYAPREVERLLMSRLHQSRSEIRKWSLDYRDYMFKQELTDLHKEQDAGSNQIG